VPKKTKNPLLRVAPDARAVSTFKFDWFSRKNTKMRIPAEFQPFGAVQRAYLLFLTYFRRSPARTAGPVAIKLLVRASTTFFAPLEWIRHRRSSQKRISSAAAEKPLKRDQKFKPEKIGVTGLFKIDFLAYSPKASGQLPPGVPSLQSRRFPYPAVLFSYTASFENVVKSHFDKNM
jgi:hypothetical protein